MSSRISHFPLRLMLWAEDRGWLRGLAVKRQRWEIQNWARSLTDTPPDEIGMVVAVGTHIRHQLESRWHIDLLDPVAAFHADPGTLFEISLLVKEFQAQARWANAAGAMIWLFTLRAAANPALRADGQALWRELAKGFGTVGKAAEQVKALSGENLDIEGGSRFPLGFGPGSVKDPT